MKKLILILIFVLLASPAIAFKVGDFQFKNKLQLFHVENDTGTYDKQLIHDIKIQRTGDRVYFQNRYQVDYDPDLDEKYYFKSTIGYELNKNVDLLFQRQDYNYKRDDETVYRFGIGLDF